MSTRRHHFDRLVLWYLGAIFLITFVGSYFSLLYLVAALAHLAMIFLVLHLTGTSARAGIRWALRWLYPALLMIPLHYEVELIGSLFHGGAVYDQLVMAWDRRLFGGHPHRFLADQLPGPVWRELFSLLYLSYFAIVGGGFWYAWRKGWALKSASGQRISEAYLRFAFVFLGAFLTYMTIFILFPVAGPLDDRFLRFHDVGLLGPLIDRMYSLADSSGGALPSSHIGEAVVVFLLLRPRVPAVRIGFLALLAGLTISTVYGSFHYAIDALAGLVSGPIFYLAWSWVYGRLKAETVDG